MLTLVGTELLKLRTTRACWGLVAGSAGLTLALAVTPLLKAGKAGTASLGTVGATLAVLGGLGRGALVALAVGVLAVSGEFRHHTLTTTFLRTPRRSRVLAAKAMAAALVGGALAGLNLVIVLTVGLAGGAVSPELLNGEIVLRELGLLLAYPLYGLLGVGLAALLPNQTIAVVVPLAWFLFLENLIVQHLVPRLAPWSLTGLTAALANAGDVAGVLPVWAGGALLLVDGLLLAWLGIGRTVRSDIT
jgi:ABC-2 type transport system permease protein